MQAATSEEPATQQDAMAVVRRRPGVRGAASPSPSPKEGWGKGNDIVRVFDHDPDLLKGLDPITTDLLRRRAVAPKLSADAGPWAPPPCPAGPGSCFGLLVLDGVIIRSVRLGSRNCPELLGAGDVLRPWDPEEMSSIRASVSWTALQLTTLAVLDERFVAAVQRWPPITSQLLSRAVQRSRTLGFQLAIVHVRCAETRVRMLLWHLADRWGRVTTEGVHLPLALTHETLAGLACMRRPTVSTALRRLTRNSELERRPGGGWLLKGDPPRPLV